MSLSDARPHWTHVLHTYLAFLLLNSQCFHCPLLKAHVGAPPYSDKVPLQLVDNSSLVYPLATLGLKKNSVSGSSVKIALVHWQGLSPDDTSWKNLDDLPLPTLRARLLLMGWY